jgi:hypothetical protein
MHLFSLHCIPLQTCYIIIVNYEVITGMVRNIIYHSELLSFWTLSIVQYSKKLKNTTFRKLDLFPSSGEGEKNT